MLNPFQQQNAQVINMMTVIVPEGDGVALGTELYNMIERASVVRLDEGVHEVSEFLYNMPDIRAAPARLSALECLIQSVVISLDQIEAPGFGRAGYPSMASGSNVVYATRNDERDSYYSRAFTEVTSSFSRWKRDVAAAGVSRYTAPRIPSEELRLTSSLHLGNRNSHGNVRLAGYAILNPNAVFGRADRPLHLAEVCLGDTTHLVTVTAGQNRFPIAYSRASTRPAVVTLSNAQGPQGSTFEAVIDARNIQNTADPKRKVALVAPYVVTMIPSGNARVSALPAFVDILDQGGDPQLDDGDGWDFSLFERAQVSRATDGRDFVVALRAARSSREVPVLWYMHTWLGMPVPLTVEVPEGKEDDPAAREPFLLDLDNRLRIGTLRLQHALFYLRGLGQDPRGQVASALLSFVTAHSRVLAAIGLEGSPLVVLQALCGAVKRVPLSQYFFHTPESAAASGLVWGELVKAHVLKIALSCFFTRSTSQGHPIMAPTYAMLGGFLPEQLAPFEAYYMPHPLCSHAFKMFVHGRDVDISSTIRHWMSLGEEKVRTMGEANLSDRMLEAYLSNAHERSYHVFPTKVLPGPAPPPGLPAPPNQNPPVVDTVLAGPAVHKWILRAISAHVVNPEFNDCPMLLRAGPYIILLWRSSTSCDKRPDAPYYRVLMTQFQKTGILPNDGTSKYITHAALASITDKGGLTDKFRMKLPGYDGSQR